MEHSGGEIGPDLPDLSNLNGIGPDLPDLSSLNGSGPDLLDLIGTDPNLLDIWGRREKQGSCSISTDAAGAILRQDI